MSRRRAKSQQALPDASARPQVRQAARSMRSHLQNALGGQQQMQYAVIRSVDPVAAELTEGGLMLDANDLVLGQTVRKYHVDHGIVEGDTLAVTPMTNGDWIATDVVSDTPLT